MNVFNVYLCVSGPVLDDYKFSPWRVVGAYSTHLEPVTLYNGFYRLIYFYKRCTLAHRSCLLSALKQHCILFTLYQSPHAHVFWLMYNDID